MNIVTNIVLNLVFNSILYNLVLLMFKHLKHLLSFYLPTILLNNKISNVNIKSNIKL